MESTSLDQLRQAARELNSELEVASGFKASGYEVGFIRFRPSESASSNQILHEDLDVVCFVLEGRGLLTLGDERVQMLPGTLCRIPARTPHDFSAENVALELLYTTIRVDGTDTSDA